MNRRDWLAGTGAIALGAGVLAHAGWPVGRADEARRRPRLAMPPLLDTRASGRLALAARAGEMRFLGMGATQTKGFNQAYLGPTIVMANGVLAAVVDNTLDEAVTVHWHGLLVPGEHDGSGHSAIEPGRRWAIDLQLQQRPTTAWYHSHAHGATARQVYAGLAGVIHHTDGRDDARGLPSTYGVDDLTLVLQDRRFDEAGRMTYDPDPTDILNGFLGGRMLVNWQFDAVAGVPKGIVRLRLVNGSNARVYTLHCNDRRPLHLIATDGGFLPRPAELTFVRLGPGQRAEILVDFSQGPAPTLMSAAGLPMKILDFEIDSRLAARIARVPDALDSDLGALPSGEMRVRRFQLTMGGSSLGGGRAPGHAGHGSPAAGHASHGTGTANAAGRIVGTMMTDFAINGRSYDPGRIDFGVELGTYERWIISGGAGVDHPFHVHGVHFRVASVGGADPLIEDSGWRDTVVASGETEIVVRFDHRAGPATPYMYHCHILEHEDSGMMGQFTVG